MNKSPHCLSVHGCKYQILYLNKEAKSIPTNYEQITSLFMAENLLFWIIMLKLTPENMNKSIHCV